MKPALFFDVETYPNFFLVNVFRKHDGVRASFELSERKPLDVDRLHNTLKAHCMVGFNSRAYDMPMIQMALRGADNATLKSISDRIIRSHMKYWETEKALGFDTRGLDHIDLFEVNPGIRQSLKMCNGRLHGRKMQDLPYEPSTVLTHEQMDEVTAYCFNDLEATIGLYEALQGPLDLREALGKEYEMDLRSLSDAQMGERIFKKRIERNTGERVYKPEVTARTFRYQAPSWITFGTQQLRDIADIIRGVEFEADEGGKIELPAVIKKTKIAIGGAVLQMGIGGLHSTEANRCIVADGSHFLLDADVASQYPNIIAKLGLSPQTVGPAFTSEYRAMIADRMAAKREGHKVRSEGLKIALNGGVFGKLGSSYSALYAPEMLIATTLTGQLSLLMLIEMAAQAGITIASANTDGVLFHCPTGLETTLKAIIGSWERDTGFELETVRYAAIYSSSVNTYIAVKPDGKTKRKGYLADYWSDKDYRGMLMHNPNMTVCSNAVVAWLTKHVPIEETIRNCSDIRQFVTVTNAKGGATWRGDLVGKVVRYYWSTDGDPILYKTPHPTTGNLRKVANTDGAKPCMELPDELPDDMDYARYIARAHEILADIGYRDEIDLPEVKRA